MTRLRKLRAAARHRIGTAVHRAGGATRTDIRRLERELAAAEHRSTARINALDGLAKTQSTRLDLLESRMETLEARAAAAEARADSLQAQATALDQARAAHSLELWMVSRLQALSHWIRRAAVSTNPVVSVILPTCDRPRLLARAIRSVQDQRYEHWELLVVDDGDDEGASAVVQNADDSRISLVRTVGKGPGAARNTALRVATGEIASYLDDDNMMDSDWLYAVVWAFEQRPDTDVLYGARVVDDDHRLHHEEPGEMPRTVLYPFDREALRRDNVADIGAVAHRTGLEEAWFDESLLEMADWDFLLRLTADREPLVLPAVACYYTTDAPNRLTGGPTHEADFAKVLERAARREEP